MNYCSLCNNVIAGDVNFYVQMKTPCCLVFHWLLVQKDTVVQFVSFLQLCLGHFNPDCFRKLFPFHSSNWSILIWDGLGSCSLCDLLFKCFLLVATIIKKFQHHCL